MANKRTLKKYLKTVAEELAGETAFIMDFYEGIDLKKADAIIDDIYNLWVEKNEDVTVAFDKTLQVSFEGNAKEYRKARRAYYKAAYNTLIAEYNDGVAEILKKMNALLSPEQRNMNKEIANA